MTGAIALLTWFVVGFVATAIVLRIGYVRGFRRATDDLLDRFGRTLSKKATP
jgi:hypothetical protein